MTSSDGALKPFVGPRPFRREDAAKFFGRDREAGELAGRWRDNRLTMLHGPPGVGKTSLVEAGVVPRLAGVGNVLPTGGVSRPRFVPAAITDDPYPHVLALLASWSPAENPLRFAGLTVRSCLRWHHGGPGGRPILAVLDHAEDVFTAHRRHPGGPIPLLDQLSDALDSDDLPLHLLVVVSDEQAGCLERHPRLGEHLARGSSYRLEPLDADAALEACRGPLDGAGRDLAPGMAERLVEDLCATGPGPCSGGPVIEPLHLQLACAAMWESLPRRVPSVGADPVDVDEVLARFCHDALREVARDHLRGDADSLTELLERVVNAGGADGGEIPEHVVRALVEHRLLRPGHKHRYEMPGRLVRPFRRTRHGRTTVATATATVDHLRAAEGALHRGWVRLAVDHADQAARSADVRSRALAESILGDAAYLRGDPGDALARYRAAARLLSRAHGTDQLVATLLTAAGRILIERGDHRGAVLELRAAARRSLEPFIHAELARALWYLGQGSGAVDVLDGALRAAGNAPEALRVRGEILSDHDPERALRDLDRLRPHESVSTRTAYALALALSGQRARALEELPPLEGDGDAVTLLRAARVMEAAGHHVEAVRLAGRAVRSESRSPLPPQLATTVDHLISA